MTSFKPTTTHFHSLTISSTRAGKTDLSKMRILPKLTTVEKTTPKMSIAPSKPISSILPSQG